jgi:MFS family permease
MSEGALATPFRSAPSARPRSTSPQGWVLIATSWLAVAAAAVVAPAAPRMAAHFTATPGAEGLVQLGIGLPALFVALLATPLGFVADRVGRRPVMMTGLLIYAACGMAPLFLHALPSILLSRAGVGVAEAGVLAAGTALIGDLFQGQTREKWFAIQAGSATIVAVILITASGVLSEMGWRTPFAIYGAPLALFALVGVFVPEPARGPRPGAEAPAGVFSGRLAAICAISLFAAICFYVALIQLPFLLVDRGHPEPSLAALGVVASAITAPVGALAFRLLGQRPVALKLALSFALSGLGLAILFATTSYPLNLFGAAVNGLGSGMALPTLMSWAMLGSSAEARGRIAGLWNASFFLGQFLSPLTLIGLAALVGGRAAGMGVVAGVLAVAAAVALSIVATRRSA